jgi:uncharacterized spore protein YtfJ
MEPAEAVSELSKMPERIGAQTCFGMPVSAGERTVIPVAEVTYGFGFGWGSGGVEQDDGMDIGGGGAGGAGSRTRGVAVIEVSPDGVAIHPVRDRTAIQLAQFAFLSAAATVLSRTLIKLFRG